MADIGLLAASLLGIVACSTPSARRIGRHISSNRKLRYQPISERYADEDGTATRESEAAYSYQIPRVVILVLSVLGLLASLALGVITAQNHRSTLIIEEWLLFGAWVCSDRSEVMAALTNSCTRLSSFFKPRRCFSSQSITCGIDCLYSVPYLAFCFQLR